MAKQDTPRLTDFEITNHRFFVLLVNDMLSGDLDELEEDFLFKGRRRLEDFSGRSAALINPERGPIPNSFVARAWPGGAAHTN